MGLIYIHGQGMIHGDLKGVRFRQLESLSYLTELICQGQHTDRPNWQRLPGGLWSAYDHLGPQIPFFLELMYTGWHGPVDEPGASRSATVWV